MAPADRTQRTYFFELWRAASAGVIEAAGITFLLLIAERHFRAGSIAKGLVAGGGSLGLFLSLFVVSLVTAAGWSPTRAASRILLTGSISFLVAALWPHLVVYVICTVIGMASSSAVIPLITQMVHENYPEADRGRRFSRTVMVRILTAAVFSQIAGDFLSKHFEYYRLLLVIFAAALGLASFCLSRCSTAVLAPDGGAHPLRALRFVKEDVLFRKILICWMLMGFGNLMMLPLRVEYLASNKYGWNLTPGMIALVTGVIPNLSRLCLSPCWGYLYDRMNFFVLRMVLNTGFAVGILLFFLSDSLTGLICGAVVYGVSNAGGDVAWGLWVMKFAPPQRVADYMSVHTFTTGVRGFVAPLLAFYLSGRLHSLSGLALASAGLIVLATLSLFTEVNKEEKSSAQA
jgi:MFS family permease